MFGNVPQVESILPSTGVLITVGDGVQALPQNVHHELKRISRKALSHWDNKVPSHYHVVNPISNSVEASKIPSLTFLFSHDEKEHKNPFETIGDFDSLLRLKELTPDLQYRSYPRMYELPYPCPMVACIVTSTMTLTSLECGELILDNKFAIGQTFRPVPDFVLKKVEVEEVEDDKEELRTYTMNPCTQTLEELDGESIASVND
ncbi:hypothetical protein EV360DRAFT_76369 [Lentinula raphanica]|nr:hypothetical protein EV360DRAFT_76369 [Lentinula raphanica]